jgi:hypothetical protein
MASVTHPQKKQTPNLALEFECYARKATCSLILNPMFPSWLPNPVLLAEFFLISIDRLFFCRAFSWARLRESSAESLLKNQNLGLLAP